MLTYSTLDDFGLEEGELRSDQLIDYTYRIPHGSAPYFVGREGRNFQRISNTRKVELTIPKRPGNIIYIRGSKHDIKDTYDDLDEIKDVWDSTNKTSLRLFAQIIMKPN